MTSSFNILNFLDKLEPAKEKNKFICPVCEGDDLGIEPETGKYKCFNGCECRDIREVLSPWKELIKEQKSGDRTMNTRIATPAKKVKKLPVAIPLGKLAIARLSEVPTDIPQPTKANITKGTRQALESKGCTSEEIKQTTVVTYDYGNGQAAYRFESPSVKNVKGYEKTFAVSHTSIHGETIWKKGTNPWKAYRQDEAIASALAVEDGCVPVILVHEGEKCVEIARGQKLAGITAQGNPGEDDWTQILNGLSQDMMGKCSFIIAYCADNDATGKKKAQTLVKVASSVNIPVVIIDLKAIKPDLCEKGDVADVLGDGMTGDELAELILQQISDAQAETISVEEEDLIDPRNPEIEFIQKITKFFYQDEEKPWISADDKIYRWDGTHYKHSPDSIERPKVASYCNSYAVKQPTKDGFIVTYPFATPGTVEQVLKWVKMRFEKDPTTLNPPGINCTNGVVRVIWEGNKPVRTLEKHDPTKHLYTYEPLIKYDPEADPTDCDRLLQCLDEPQQQILLRNLGASIDLSEVRKRRGREVKILLACGLGSNGKDALRQTVSTIFGHQGMTSVSLADFSHYDDGRKFALAPLINSRVNWASENPQTARLDKIQSLKLFATGNNLHSERKGKDHIEYTPVATGIFNLNDVPALQGTIQAIQDRIAPLEFRKTFKKDPDPDNPNELPADPRFAYDEHFVQTSVAPAFLNKMLDGLEALIEEGIDYECTTEAFKSMQKENNHLFQFCDDIGLDYVANSSMTAMEIWEKLEMWYIENGTLTMEGDRKVWSDQVRPSDKNVKAINQVISRFKQLFPKATLTTVPHAKGKRMVQALKGIGIITSSNDPFTIKEFSAPVSEFSAPVPHQSPHQETLINQDLRTNRTSFTNMSEAEKNNDEKIISSSNDGEVEQNSSKLVRLVREDVAPMVSEISTGAVTGAEEPLTGAEDAENIRIALADENASDMLYVLLSEWDTERKKAAREHLTQDEVSKVQSYVNQPLKPLTFTFKAGDRIKCYPTQMHQLNEWEVSALVLEVKVERGWFAGCTVEYMERGHAHPINIPGGCVDWILRKI